MLSSSQTSADSAEASGIGSDAESAVERGPNQLQGGSDDFGISTLAFNRHFERLNLLLKGNLLPPTMPIRNGEHRVRMKEG